MSEIGGTFKLIHVGAKEPSRLHQLVTWRNKTTHCDADIRPRHMCSLLLLTPQPVHVNSRYVN